MRYLLTRIKGRIKIIDAPVVPTMFAINAPMARNTTFVRGRDLPHSRMWIPPVITYSEPTRAMKPRNSISEWRIGRGAARIST